MSSSPTPSSPRPLVVRAPGQELWRLECFGLSDPGRMREKNEDSYLVAPDLGLVAVADGVGGGPAGDVASAMAIAALLRSVEDTAAVWPEALGAPALARAVKEAHLDLLDAAARDPRKAGMATTLTALLALGDRAAIAHVGDSRAYLLRGRTLTCLTEDHSHVAACVRAGILTAADAARSNARNGIYCAVGFEGGLEVDTRVVALEHGDTLVLCSDGLHGVIGDEGIAFLLLHERDLQRAATWLVEVSNRAGGPDNITVVLVRVG